METFIFSLSPLVGLLILCAFRGVSVHKSVTNKSIDREESALEKNISTCRRPTRIFIPNVLASARWQWPRRINPNYAVVKKEADAWLSSFQAFSPKAQDAFNRCDFSKCFLSYSVCILILFDRPPRLFSLPYSQKRYSHGEFIDQIICSVVHSEHARSGCDLMHLFFVFDEYSDRSPPPEVRKQKGVVMDALRNPHTPRPKGEWIGGEVARQ